MFMILFRYLCALSVDSSKLRETLRDAITGNDRTEPSRSSQVLAARCMRPVPGHRVIDSIVEIGKTYQGWRTSGVAWGFYKS